MLRHIRLSGSRLMNRVYSSWALVTPEGYALEFDQLCVCTRDEYTLLRGAISSVHSVRRKWTG
jgi:hypothetical protein